MDNLKKYRVHMHSIPGMWTSYDGHVDVFAYDEEEAASAAIDKLKRGSFSDRPRSSWVVDAVDMLG